MSKKTSFEEALRQKLDELPLPDENESWQKMNALLDEKEKRRFFFFFRNGKIVGGALLLGALVFGFILFTQTKKQTANLVAYKRDSSRNVDKETHSNESTLQNNRQENNKEAKQAIMDSSLIASSGAPVYSLKNNSTLSIQKSHNLTKSRHSLREEKGFSLQRGANGVRNKNTVNDKNSGLLKQEDTVTPQLATQQIKNTTTTADSSLSFVKKNTIGVSSATADSNLNTATLKSNIQKTDSFSSGSAASAATVHAKPHGSFFIDIGIGIKQQIPVDSQAFVGYNDKGKKSWAGDYIPSLYVRLEKEKRWFLQGEFHYASPRMINSISYWQKTNADYGHGSVTAERYYLQKTWYSQLPLSFNMYVRPSFSVGAGVMYNRLHGAAAEKETSVYNAISNQYVSSYERLPWKGFTDSFLYKNNTSLLLQADYQVKQWSFGFRYVYDVQPFLTYTLPDGEKKDKRNTSLELMIRYRFYRSGKFRIGKL